MRKVTDFIVNESKLILILFLILSVFCIILMQKVNINSDMSKYLPATSETKIGNDIMNKEFDPLKSSTLYVMFEDLDNKEKALNTLENIKNVSSVTYDNSLEYNKDNYTLFIVNVDDTSDSKIASEVYSEVISHFKGEKITLDGDIATSNKAVLPTWIFVLAVGSAVIILLIMSDNIVEPFLILYSVGIAVFLNKGSNILFDSVSSVTDGIVAILQMALSMDYSIILINRFKQEKKHFEDNKSAMREALYKSVGSIASSSLTTIVGLLVLIFMSFTIGRDLGIVLAKGVLLSLVSIFFCLPGLLLIFDKLILKTHKKILEPKFNFLSKFIYRFRYVTLVLIVVLFIVSSFLKGNLGYLYTESEVSKIEKIFKKDNQMALIYNNHDEEFVSNYCNNFNVDDNIKKVLCYGNTINKNLKYDELKKHVEFLGEDISDIDDYIIKILYYDYYNKNTNNLMTFPEFVDFIRSEIYSNESLKDKVNEYRNDIERLRYFTYLDEINILRNAEELSNIFGIDEDKIELLLVYYNSKQDKNIKLTLNEFVDFIDNKVLNSNYKEYLDYESREDIKELSKYININEINSKTSARELSNYFDIDENLVDKLYTYYLINSYVDSKLSIKEFVDFALNYVVNDEVYSKYFNEDTMINLKQLENFTDYDYINTLVDSNELSNTFNIEEQNIKKLLYLYYRNLDSDDSYTIIELITNLKFIKENTNYLDDINYEDIIYNSDYMNYKLNKDTLYNYFDSILVDEIYETFNLNNDYEFSISDILSILSNYLDENSKDKFKDYLNNITDLNKEIIDNLSNYIDPDILNNIEEYISDLVEEVNNNSKSYTSCELAEFLGIDKSITNNIYALIKLVNDDTSDWKLSRIEFVEFLLNNKEYLDNDSMTKLELLQKIMNSTLNNNKYTYSELSSLLSIDSEKIKSVYAIYTYQKNGLKLTPNETIKFIINHASDDMLKTYLTNDYLDRIYLVNKIFDSVNNNTSYNYKELANFLNVDQNKLKLLYGLYDTSNNETFISIQTFTNFIVDDVLKSEYQDSFTDKNKSDITTINGIVNSSIKGIKYTKDEMLAILSKLSPNIDKDTVSLLYMYYGSSKQYDNNYTLTIEKLVDFLNKDILNDSRFDEFIDTDMQKKITDSKEKVSDAKKMLVGDNYSRMLIITNYENESQSTFDFIRDTRSDLDEIDDKYLIGNSPMALDISNTFDSELNFITLLTIISIFIVVALTFKSIISPLIITLIIQCSVFVTMGILSFSGEPVYFISLLVVQSILMGATIDYGIVYTTYYLEMREKYSSNEAIGKAYRKSSHTILTSGTILILVTFIIGLLADGVTSKICMTLSKGTLCSVILILFILPGVMAALDKIIVRHKK